MTGGDWFSPEQAEGFRRIAENAKAVREHKAGIAATLSLPGGPARVDAMVRQMRASVAALNAVSREVSKTADTLASARRKHRFFGVRA